MYEKREYLETGEEVEKDSKWREVSRELSKREKRKLLGKVVEIGVMILMRNHVYQFEGKNRVQREGGSIGLKLTGVVAKLRMIRWTL